MERTLILVKPDAFAAALTGEIVGRFERKGLRIAALKRMSVGRDLAEAHYAEHRERDFFGELVSFITSGPVVAMALEGMHAVRAARQVIGATDPLDAAPGSIRGDLALQVGRNLVHGSDSPESAARELWLFFPELQRRSEHALVVILASSSPQRRAILERLGIELTVRAPGILEIEEGDPAGLARENALCKARAVARTAPDALVLGADTVVALDGAAYGKPRDEAHARSTLAALSGREHVVLGAIAICAGTCERAALTTTAVRFRELDQGLIDWYLAKGEWRGRAGGYAIQGAGAVLVREVHGDYENVVGLPVATLLDMCPELLRAH